MNFSELNKKLHKLDESLAPPSGPIMQSECEGMGGCGNASMPAPVSTPPQPDSVNMTVSMNGTGKGGIRDLIDVLRNIESSIEPEKHQSKGGDEIVVGEPSVLDDIEPIAFEEPTMPSIEEPVIPEFGMSLDEPDIEDELDFEDEPEFEDEGELEDEPVMDEIEDNSFANKLDRKTLAISAVLGTGDDLSSKGKEAPKQAGGGNPWNINESSMVAKLARHYNEVKTRRK